MNTPIKLFIVTFFDGDKDNWEITSAFTQTEAVKKVTKLMKDEYETEIEYAEAYAIPDVDNYYVVLTPKQT